MCIRLLKDHRTICWVERGQEERQGEQQGGHWVSRRERIQDLIPLPISGSVHLSASCSQLSLTTHPSPLARGRGVVVSPPLAWPLCPAPGPLSQDSQVKPCPGLASELLSAHPPTSTLLLPRPQEQGPGWGHPRSEGRAWSPPRDRGQRGSVQDRPRQLGSPCQQERSPVGRLLPEAHTRPSVIKAISHLPTGEPQARAATAGSAWGFVLGGSVGTSRQRWVGLESKDCPPFWLR